MRTRGFTLVEIMIVVLIIGVLLSIAVPQFMTARERTHRTTCYANQQKLEEAKQNWILDTEQTSSSTPAMGDLVPLYIVRTPTCPTHGVYALGDGLAKVTCPNHP